MRPLRLVMQAFGPFAAIETVDFTALGHAPLFLINGPTGAGKTTILDAICYALYGVTTGDEREPREMRSQQSDPGLLTEVTLDFELAGVRYRVVRSPDQLRPKRRGEGFTSHKSRADLHRLGPGGGIEGGELLVEQRVREVSDYICRLTGMEAEQFRQVMVLPQGQFRKLLMADSRERESIFQTLFQTGVYKRIEEALKERSSQVRAAHERATAVVLSILEDAGVGGAAELEQRIGAAGAQLAAQERTRDVAREHWQQAEAARRAGEQLAQDFARLAESRAERASLQARRPAMEGLRVRLAQAQKAAKLVPLQLQAQQLERNRQDLQTRLDQATKQADAARQARQLAAETLEREGARSAERESLAATVRELQSYRGRAEELLGMRQALAAAQEEAAAASRLLEKAGAERSEHLDREGPLRDALGALERRIEEAAGAELRVEQIGGLLARRRELEALADDERRAVAELAAAGEAHAAAEAHRQQSDRDCKLLQKAWHENQAAALALELEDGEPCPVCGSSSHPDPARGGAAPVNQDALDAAARALEQSGRALVQATAALTERRAGLTALQERRARLQEGLGDAVRSSVEQVEAQLEQARQRVLRLLDDRQRLQQLKRDLVEQARIQSDLDARLERARQALSAAQARVAGAAAQHEAAQKALPEAYREPGRLESALSESRARLDALQQQLRSAENHYRETDRRLVAAESALQHAGQNLAAATDAAERAGADWQAALQTSDFETALAVTRASLDEAESARITGELRDYDDLVLTVAARVDTLASQLEGKQQADLPQLTAAEEAARESRDAAERAWSEAEQQLGLLRRTRSSLASRTRELAELDERYAVVGTLADVASGQKGARVNLQRYVLGVLLDDVLVHATRRLLKMSDGRYELVRRREPGGGRRPSGLDLEVYDDYTGESRSVATLSGGESFMAALSLALGLSDVVQAQSGGIRLDTLFVDEGFGTLDSEALEMAVGTLMDLQQAGRMVGVISHVAELREQMDVRIDISKGKSGSAIRLVSPLLG